MTSSRKILVAATLGLTVLTATPDLARIALNGSAANGVYSNGVNLNGHNLNGLSRNGLSRNGLGRNGWRTNGWRTNGWTCGTAIEQDGEPDGQTLRVIGIELPQ